MPCDKDTLGARLPLALWGGQGGVWGRPCSLISNGVAASWGAGKDTLGEMGRWVPPGVGVGFGGAFPPHMNLVPCPEEGGTHGWGGLVGALPHLLQQRVLLLCLPPRHKPSFRPSRAPPMLGWGADRAQPRLAHPHPIDREPGLLGSPLSPWEGMQRVCR